MFFRVYDGGMATHFSVEAMRFLRGLKRNNDRVWFAERKYIYERAVKAPMVALVSEVNEALAEFAPEHVRPPQKAMLRIYRDVRFSSDKRPYKIHQAAWWGREGMPKTSGAGFYLSVNAERVVVAAGLFMPDAEQLLAVRRMLLQRHPAYRSAVKVATRRGAMTASDGQPLTRAPKGFPAEHAAVDLIKQRRWGVSVDLPAEAALEPGLVREVVRRFRLAAAMVEMLNAPVTKQRRPLFGLDGSAVSRG